MTRSSSFNAYALEERMKVQPFQLVSGCADKTLLSEVALPISVLKPLQRPAKKKWGDHDAIEQGLLLLRQRVPHAVRVLLLEHWSQDCNRRRE